MKSLPPWTAVLCALACASSTATAQSVGGRVLSAAGRQPIAHVLVVVLDEAGRLVGSVLSDSAGRFVLRVPVPGRYTVRAERIGYASETSAPFAIDAAFHTHDVVLAERPFTLRGVRAEVGGRGCETRRDGAATVELWTEIQKALRLTMFTDTRAALTYTTLQYERELDAQLAKVEREQQTYRSGRARAPFGALAPAELMANGFSRAAGEETELLGLDARVLLSPEFVDHYCFRIRASPQLDLIGLGFEPIRRRRGTDVRGVLWVDRNTAELRYLAYEYLHLPAHLEAHDARSEVHFRRLSTGLWVVERWWIRTPRLATAQSPVSVRIERRYQLIGYREEGGVLLAAEDGTTARYQLIGGGAVTGRVTGRTDATTRGRTTVSLSGTAHLATADSSGNYRIVGIPPGTYALIARDSLLDALRLPVRLDSLRVVTGRTTTHDYAWPAQPDILRALCPGEEEETMEANHGLLYGDVVDPETRRPLGGAEVRVAWRARDATGGMDRWRSATTGSDGRYYVCWVATGVELNLSVTAPASPTRSFQLEPVTRIKRVDVR